MALPLLRAMSGRGLAGRLVRSPPDSGTFRGRPSGPISAEGPRVIGRVHRSATPCQCLTTAPTRRITPSTPPSVRRVAAIALICRGVQVARGMGTGPTTNWGGAAILNSLAVNLARGDRAAGRPPPEGRVVACCGPAQGTPVATAATDPPTTARA